MKIAWLVAGLCLASAAASVIPIKGERKLADANFLKRQRLVLDLYVGLGHDDHFQNEFADYDILANSEQFTDPSAAKKFMEIYASGLLPKDEIFTLSCHHVRYQVARLFEVFYYAKDFDTFFKVASWAKKHVNPIMFSYTYTLALLHREDTRAFSIPPMYEVFPNYFVPMDTMHEVYDYKMAGIKQGKFEYNNTGYEYNYHHNMFGGPMSFDVMNPHMEYKVSYFREDVGLNAHYPFTFRYPSWMNVKKYNMKNYFRRGEAFYLFHQQLLARYTLERLANALPYVEAFSYDKPIQVGYNPRIAHFNGEALLARPDDYVMKYSPNQWQMRMAMTAEQRLLDAIDYGGFWNASSDSLYNLLNDDGIDMLGHLMLGSLGHKDPNAKYFGAYYYNLIEALGYLAKTKNNYNYNGGATTLKISTLRDPAFYNLVVRIVGLFQKLKSNLPFYHSKDLKFNGVSVTNFEVDKLITYFDMFDFEVTNGVAVKDPKDYIDHKYYASQYRLNHKPYNYKVTVNSDAAYDGIVRVFIGPKYDSEEKVLTLSQKRMAMVEIDRFPVKIAAGQNVFERNSKESPFFTSDMESYRALYERIDHALKTNEPYYYSEKISCGIPERLQLPRGWRSGHPYTFAVVVMPFDHKDDHPNEYFCGSNKLYDHRPYGFPFDRPLMEEAFKVPNIFFKDEIIYHKSDVEVNRAN